MTLQQHGRARLQSGRAASPVPLATWLGPFWGPAGARLQLIGGFRRGSNNRPHGGEEAADKVSKCEVRGHGWIQDSELGKFQQNLLKPSTYLALIPAEHSEPLFRATTNGMESGAKENTHKDTRPKREGGRQGPWRGGGIRVEHMETSHASDDTGFHLFMKRPHTLPPSWGM